MVAVGTRISPRPPHRSRRALLTHRAPPSGQTSCDERFSHVRRPTRSHYSYRRGISAQCPRRGRLSAVPLGRGPSLHGLRRGQALFVRPLLGYYDPVRILIRVHVHRSAVAFMNRPGLPVRTRMRLPRFRAKNFSTCTRSPTARGSSHASHSPWDDVAFSSSERDRHLGIGPVSQLNTWPVVSPVNASRLPSRAEPRASLGVGVVG